jgi:hypothetical protein
MATTAHGEAERSKSSRPTLDGQERRDLTQEANDHYQKKKDLANAEY